MNARRCRLVINADDFGLSEGVNRGILEAHAAGTVTSTSLMANAPATDSALAAAHRTPRLGIGLHFNVTAGHPLELAARVPSLCDNRTGRFHSLSQLVLRALAGKIVPEHVAAECDAQIARLRDAGFPITHLDSHHHVHVMPSLWRAVAERAHAAGIKFVRRPVEALRSTTHRPVATAAQVLFRLSHRIGAGRAPAIRRPDHFSGFALTGVSDFRERLLHMLDGLAPGTTELMVHPGYSDAALSGWVRLTKERELELEALTSAPLRNRLARSDIELVDFGAL